MFDRVYTKFNEEITFHVDDNIFNVHSANYAYQFKAKKIGRGEVYFTVSYTHLTLPTSG